MRFPCPSSIYLFKYFSYILHNKIIPTISYFFDFLPIILLDIIPMVILLIKKIEAIVKARKRLTYIQRTKTASVSFVS